MTDWGEDGRETASQGLVRVSIKNRLPEIVTVTEALEDFAHSCNLPEAIQWRFQLAIEELLRNVIAHAYPDSSDHEIGITLACDGVALTATIADDGIPFNPLNAAPPDLSEVLEDREVGGLGIHLARSVVETLTYAWQDGKNVVTVSSKLTSQ